MKPTLSTLGCPDWSLETICERAREYGFDGVDFRGILDEVDITKTLEFTDRLAESQAALDAANLPVACLSSTITICDETNYETNLAEAERYIDLATTLDAPYVRVFGMGDGEAHSLDVLAAIAGETIADVLALPGADEVTWILETHDNWTSIENWQLLLDQLPDELGVLWDAGHTTRIADEDPAATLDALGEKLEYVHAKDAVYEPDHPNAMDDGWRYVLPGEGDLPLATVIDELDARGYDGWVAFEHEKRWHRDLPEPEVAYPAFVEWFESVR